jgi:RNA-binding protein YlmH
MDRERLLSHLEGEERLEMARVIEGAQRALERTEPVWTDFFDPRLRELAVDILRQAPEVRALSYGGHKKAERQRLVLIPSFYLTESIEPELEFFRIRSDKQIELTHRDVLGAVIGLGIRREKIGDILIADQEVQIVVAREVAPAISQGLVDVGKAKVQVETIDPEELAIAPDRVKEIRTTVSSLRLDAVASLGYGVSRTRMAREIKGERLKINWRTIKDPDHPVQAGDVLSMRGRGRVMVYEVTGKSKKGRIGLILHRVY